MTNLYLPSDPPPVTKAQSERHKYDVLYEPKLQEWLQSLRPRVHQDTHDLLQNHWPHNEGMTFVCVPKVDVNALRDRTSLTKLKGRYPYLELSLNEAIKA